jgi:uncharacterized metal-binding protein YceD (DUF177 family)
MKVKKRGAYSVRLSGLKDGEHHFRFQLGEAFFKELEFPDISGGSLSADICLDKKPSVTSMIFHLSGSVAIVCDRCLEYYDQEIDVRETMYVKFDEDQSDLNENMIHISREEHEIIIDQYLSEFIILALPLKKVHPDMENGESGCNNDMLERLNEHLIKDEHENNDPRWDELKRLIEKNN